MKSARCAPSRSSASAKRSLTRSQSCGVMAFSWLQDGLRAVHDLSMEPGFGHDPVALHRPDGNRKNSRNLLLGQAAKEAQLHDAALPRVELGQFIQCTIQRQHAYHVRLKRDGHGF